MAGKDDRTVVVLELGSFKAPFGCAVDYADLMLMMSGELDKTFVEARPVAMAGLPIGTETIRKPMFVRADAVVGITVLDENVAYAIRTGCRSLDLA